MNGILIEAPYCLLGAQDRLTQRVVLEEILGEDFMHQVVGIVLIHLDLFQDDATLAHDLVGVEDRMQDHVAQNIDRERQMLVQDLDVEADRLFAGKGVHVAADGIHLAGDIFGGAVGCPLEHHVLDKMRNAIYRRVLVTRAGLHPDPHRDRADVVHVFGQDGEPVGQNLALYIANFFNH